MHPKPKTITELQAIGDYEAQCLALLEHLALHWDGIDDIKPKGYAEFLKDYEDFQGIEEWGINERPKQEAVFNGFDNSTAGGFNFIGSTCLPHVAYDDTNQGRPPIMVLIGACVSYGMAIGEIYGARSGRQALMNKVLGILLEETKEKE